MKELPRKKIVVFLDYDGTLSPIVDDPDRAFMSPEVNYYYYKFYIFGSNINVPHFNIHSNLRKIVNA